MRNLSKKFSTLNTINNIKNKIKNDGIQTITMGFPDIYGRFIGKKYDSDYFVDGVISKGSNACNYLLGCDIEFTPLPNTELSSYQLGYGDFMMKPDFNAVKEIDYISKNKQLLLFSDLYYIEDDKEMVKYAPRYLLKNSVENLQKHGISVKVEYEINFTAFLEKFRKNMKDLSLIQPITEHNNLANVFYSASHENMLNSIKNSSKTSKIPLIGIYGDSGEGQFKLSVDKQNCVETSDSIVLLKLVSKYFINR